MNARRNSVCLLVFAMVCALSVWLYVRRVLVPHQIADAAAQGKPRGNLSDLYPRWLGTQELFLHGRSPYSREVMLDIQRGYYGRVLDSSRPNDPRDQQGFAYPAYVAFFLAPTVRSSFESVQRGFMGVMLLLTITSAFLWLKVLRWSLSIWEQITVAVLVLGDVAVVQALKLQQISLVVAGLLAIAITLLVNDHLVPAGILLALATIKPQLTALLLFWLAIWVFSEWRHRYRLAVSFLVSMAVLCGAAELYVPGWIPQFWHALGDYRKYTGAVPVLEEGLPLLLARVAEAAALIATVLICRRNRRASENSEVFASTTSLVLAMTVLLVPSFAPYNQILLVPVILLMLRDWRQSWRAGLAARVLMALTSAFLFWPGISSMVLASLSFLMPVERVGRAWALPFWTVFPLPVTTAALMLVYHYRCLFARSDGGAAA